MIFEFDKQRNEIEICKKTNFKDHRIFERQHIEKWIESTPDILGEDLLMISNEYDAFDKTNERLDLLAIDRDGNVVVIELKRDDSGKNADLQALKYAAYCSTLTLSNLAEIYQNYKLKNNKKLTVEESRKSIIDFIQNDDFEEINDKPRIILVSKEYRPEVTASVLWLRKFNIDIKCVKLTPYEIINNKIIIEVNTIIPLPEAEEFIIKSELKENQEGNISVTKQEYIDIYSELSAILSKRISKPLKMPKPKSYYQIDAGIGGVHYEWGFHGRPRSSFGVELHFERDDSNSNKDLINKLKPIIPLIEKATSEAVIFQEQWGQKWSRLYIEYPKGNIDETLKNWAVDKMELFINTIQPEIDKLK